MTRTELRARVAARSSLSKAVAGTLSVLTSTIVVAPAEGETVAGFGKFAVTTHAARQAHEPRTGGSVAVPVARLPTIRPQPPFTTPQSIAIRVPWAAIRLLPRRCTRDPPVAPPRHPAVLRLQRPRRQGAIMYMSWLGGGGFDW